MHTHKHTHTHTHTHTHLVGFLRMSDQPIAEAATYTTYNKPRRWTSMALDRIQTHNPNSQAASYLHLRQHSHWDDAT